MVLESQILVVMDEDREKGADTSTEAVNQRLPWAQKLRRVGTFT